MSTSDLVVSNDTMPNVRADINVQLAAIGSQQSGTADPAAMLAYERQARTDTGLVRRRNAANSGWVIDGTLAETFLISRSTNTILGTANHGTTIKATSSFTQTLTAAATLGDGWMCCYRNEGVGVITIDPNASETIDGAATITLNPGDSCIILCDGSNFKTIGRNTPSQTIVTPVLSGATSGTWSLAGTITWANNLIGFASRSIVSTGTAAGSQILNIQDANRDSVVVYANGDTTNYNAANCVLTVRQAAGTGRSINAAGTINASGADYAEYEKKRGGCGTIEKGQIIGFDSDGLLTDQWSQAMTFGVKSTMPAYVGGDVWFNQSRPAAPADPISDPTADDDELAATDAAHAAKVVAWRADTAQLEAALEAARQTVDRIAYAGKVPVNVMGATVGQWIVPSQSGNGIVGRAVNAFDPGAVGRVRRILPDGRAEIVVMAG